MSAIACASLNSENHQFEIYQPVPKRSSSLNISFKFVSCFSRFTGHKWIHRARLPVCADTVHFPARQ